MLPPCFTTINTKQFSFPYQSFIQTKPDPLHLYAALDTLLKLLSVTLMSFVPSEAQKSTPCALVSFSLLTMYCPFLQMSDPGGGGGGEAGGGGGEAGGGGGEAGGGGGGYSSSLTTAIKDAFNSGVYFVVAAGNSNANACNYSPANAPEAITVAASDGNDYKASFSNYGSCVDLYAPGACLNGAYPGNRYTVLCGTSMASPMAAGILAVYLSRFSRNGYNTFFDSLSTNTIKNNPPELKASLIAVVRDEL
jgi:hypothetical protein